MKTRCIAALASLSLAGGCATTDHGTRVAGERPTDLATTEASFWYQMDQAEADLRVSGRVVEDPSLSGYVTDIVCRVAGEYCNDVRVYVVDSPVFNASMSPNGMVLVSTGMLLRVENEAQLAFVLAHEFVHFLENHALEQHAAASNSTIAAAVFGSVLSIGIAAGTGVAPGQGYSGTGGSLAASAAYAGAFGYSRELEREADAKGFDILVERGYDPHAATQIWRNFLDEVVASDDARRQRRANSRDPYATHPRMTARIDELAASADGLDPSDDDPHAYREIIRPFLKDWLDAQIVLGDAGATLHLIERLEGLGTDLGVLTYARARVYALRQAEGDEALAVEFFEAATGHADVPADAYRNLGEYYRTAGRDADAADAFEMYLYLAPDARDALFIERVITTLRG